MSFAQLLPMVLFIVVTSVTPGPNNMMLLSSGVRFGVRRSVPHLLGVSWGGAFMMAMAGLGIAGLFARWPLLQTLLRWAGMAYLLWLAWQMTRMSAPQEPPATPADAADSPNLQARPLGFWGAAAFQWINPKAWVMALGLFSTYMPAHSSTLAVLLAALLYGVINMPCVSVWAVAGQGLRHWLQHPPALRAFNWSMAALLLASMLPVLHAA